MLTLIRLTRVLTLLVLAVFVVSLIIGLAGSETGALEKIVLLVVIAGCVAAAAKVSSIALAAERKFHHQ